MKWAAVIVAAGHGRRFGRPKQFIELAGLPMVGWSIRIFSTMTQIVEIVVATEYESLDPMRALVAQLSPECATSVVRGGRRRQDSVYEGLRGLAGESEAVLVHDGARPLVRREDVLAGMDEVRAGRGSLLAVPVIDTIKSVDPATRRVRATLDRQALWAAQTPQFALTADLRAAHEQAQLEGFEATDDAMLLERAGIEVAVVPSTDENFKVTLPADIARAQAILQAREMRACAG